MGVTVSKGVKADKESTMRSTAIDKQLLQDQKYERAIIKLLLLGTAESGKSTILKQMKILHAQGFTDFERNHEKMIICENILQAVASMVKAIKKEDIKFEALAREEDAKLVLEAALDTAPFRKFYVELAASIQRLWADGSVQMMYLRATEIQLPDSTKYFLDDFDRICEDNYQPSEQDILRSRKATTGVTEVTFTINEASFKVIDVGGQRSERRKWIHCFENVQAIIFMAPLSEYNQVLIEDQEQNRMAESLELFSCICNSNWFTKTSMILFLNKTDLFEEKIKTYPITMLFQDYHGPQTYEDSLAFIQDKFESKRKNKSKIIYTHRTCATDTTNVEKVFRSCIDMLIRQNLARTGFY